MQAVEDVPLGLGDIALTTRPGAASPGGTKTYTYAPLAISAVSIAYWIDDPVTGKPLTKLKLDPRVREGWRWWTDPCRRDTAHATDWTLSNP